VDTDVGEPLKGRIDQVEDSINPDAWGVWMETGNDGIHNCLRTILSFAIIARICCAWCSLQELSEKMFIEEGLVSDELLCPMYAE